MITLPVLVSGATVGVGLTLLARSMGRQVPDLAAALARLDGMDQPRPAAFDHAPAALVTRWWTDRAPAWAAQIGLDRYRSDLALVGSTTSTLLAHKVAYAAVGLAFPPLLVAVMSLIGLSLPLAIPALGSLVLAAILFLGPDVDLRRRAAQTRVEMRRAVCVYLELVALERAADAGAVEALERAAEVGDGRAFELIRDSLLRAHLGGVPPWEGLARLADQLRVPELGDVADIMRLSGEDGAAVYVTLRARASSLRTALLAEDTAAANAASERMVMPVALLGLAFLALLAYPAFAQILFG